MLFGVFILNSIFAESAVKIVASATKKKNTKNYKKVVSEIGPSMFRNIIGPVFNTTSCFLEKKPLLSAGKNEIFKNTKKKMLAPEQKTQKWLILDQF